MSTVKADVHASVKNKAIDEYFKWALMGVIASNTGSRQPTAIATSAMELAIAAYDKRCAVLGITFSKSP